MATTRQHACMLGAWACGACARCVRAPSAERTRVESTRAATGASGERAERAPRRAVRAACPCAQQAPLPRCGRRRRQGGNWRRQRERRDERRAAPRALRLARLPAASVPRAASCGAGANHAGAPELGPRRVHARSCAGGARQKKKPRPSTAACPPDDLLALDGRHRPSRGSIPRPPSRTPRKQRWRAVCESVLGPRPLHDGCAPACTWAAPPPPRHQRAPCRRQRHLPLPPHIRSGGAFLDVGIRGVGTPKALATARGGVPWGTPTCAYMWKGPGLSLEASLPVTFSYRGWGRTNAVIGKVKPAMASLEHRILYHR